MNALSAILASTALVLEPQPPQVTVLVDTTVWATQRLTSLQTASLVTSALWDITAHLVPGRPCLVRTEHTQE